MFYREANRLQLTAFGRQMTPLLNDISDRTEAAAAAETFRLLRQHPVRLGVMPTFDRRPWPLPVRFPGRHPGIEVAVSEGRIDELASRLEADALDVAILNPLDESVGERLRIEPVYV